MCCLRLKYLKIKGAFMWNWSIANLVLLAVAVILSCAPGPTTPPPEEKPLLFETKSIDSIQVSSDKAVTLTDSASGLAFSFPDGGDGTLTVKALSKLPEIDTMNGKGYYIEYTGSQKMNLLLTRSAEIEPQVWVYGNATVPLDFVSKSDSIWMPLTPTDTFSIPAVFELGLPCLPYDSIDVLHKSMRPTTYKRPDHSYYLYFKNAMKANDWAWNKSVVLWDLTKKTIEDLRAILPTSVQLDKYSEFQLRLKPSGASSGWSTGYIGFTYYVGLVRSADPHFWYGVYSSTASPDDDAVAHECGHYISHVLLGDDKYEQLTNQRQKIHDIGDVHTTRPMLEEYAFFACYYKGGHLLYKKYDIEEPNSLFKEKRSFIDKVSKSSVTPARYDWPGIESFACAFLARLQTTSTTVKSHVDEKPEAVPVFGKSFTELYGILAQSPMTVNELYEKTLASLSGEDKILMRVMAEKIGWSYHGSGKILDSAGRGVKNVIVKNIPVADGLNLYDNLSSAPSAQDGTFTLDRLLPDSSLLRVINGADTMDIPVYIDHTQPTTKNITLGSITLKKTGPHIASVTPSLGLPGTVVSLKGKKFGMSAGALVCGEYFVSPVSMWNDTTITFAIPQMYNRGNIPIYLATKDGIRSDTVIFTVGDTLSAWQKIRQCNILILEYDLAVMARHIVQRYGDGTLKREPFDSVITGGGKIATDFYVGSSGLRWTRDTFTVDTTKENTYSRIRLFAKGTVDTVSGKVLSAIVSYSKNTLSPSNPDKSLDSLRTVVELLSFALSESHYGNYTSYFTGGATGSAAQISSITKSITNDEFKFMGIDQADTATVKRDLYQSSHDSLSNWQTGASYMSLRFAK
jgi:hypothetical protein